MLLSCFRRPFLSTIKTELCVKYAAADWETQPRHENCPSLNRLWLKKRHCSRCIWKNLSCKTCSRHRCARPSLRRLPTHAPYAWPWRAGVGVPYFLPRQTQVSHAQSAGWLWHACRLSFPRAADLLDVRLHCCLLFWFGLCCLPCAALALCCSCQHKLVLPLLVLLLPCAVLLLLVLLWAATCAPTPLCLLLACGVSVSGMSGAVMFSYVSCHCVCCSVSAALTFPDHV